MSADLGSVQERITSTLERDFEPLELPANVGGGVEDVFVIDGSGVLLTHASRVEESDTDRKSTRLNSSHPSISYAVFCLKKKKKKQKNNTTQSIRVTHK